MIVPVVTCHYSFIPSTPCQGSWNGHNLFLTAQPPRTSAISGFPQLTGSRKSRLGHLPLPGTASGSSTTPGDNYLRRVRPKTPCICRHQNHINRKISSPMIPASRHLCHVFLPASRNSCTGGGSSRAAARKEDSSPPSSFGSSAFRTARLRRFPDLSLIPSTTDSRKFHRSSAGCPLLP